MLTCHIRSEVVRSYVNALGAGGSGTESQEILSILALSKLFSEYIQLVAADEAVSEGDLLGAGDLDALAALQGTDEIAGFEQAVGRASVESGVAAPHQPDVQLAALNIGPCCRR
jgi:hypothetical protein